MGTPKAYSRNVSDLPLRLFVRDCTRALSARPLVCPWLTSYDLTRRVISRGMTHQKEATISVSALQPPIGLDSFSYLSCVFAARSASVSHRSAISMKNDLCAEVRAASANRMHSAALLRN